MPEPKDTQYLLSDERRKQIANHLRFIADRLQQGLITPDDFNMEPEWVDVPPRPDGIRGQKPTGRIRLRFDYWTQPVEPVEKGTWQGSPNIFEPLGYRRGSGH